MTIAIVSTLLLLFFGGLFWLLRVGKKERTLNSLHAAKIRSLPADQALDMVSEVLSFNDRFETAKQNAETLKLSPTCSSGTQGLVDRYASIVQKTSPRIELDFSNASPVQSNYPYVRVGTIYGGSDTQAEIFIDCETGGVVEQENGVFESVADSISHYILEFGELDLTVLKQGIQT
jgi:hypothetical protein